MHDPADKPLRPGFAESDLGVGYRLTQFTDSTQQRMEDKRQKLLWRR
jgi:hypothetical protein